uniref:Uncharacterized protein n=1 Tax=Sphaerodactylus townsendi TaxID=933632 RepID=A0ACB8E7U8_9SAUR
MNTYLLPASLNNKLTVTIFIFCSYLLQVQTIHFATLRAVLADLEKIKPCSKIDATLYTAEMTDRNECKESVMKCFILEMEVIFHESNYGHSSATFTNNVHNVLKNFSHFRNSSYSVKVTLYVQTWLHSRIVPLFPGGLSAGSGSQKGKRNLPLLENPP